MRLALGADRRRVIRQLLTESVVLGVSGGALGVAAASIAIRLLVHWVPVDLPLTGALSVDTTVLLFALAITIGASLLFGLVPALKATRPDLNEALKAGSRSHSGSQRHRLNTGLVVAEMALAVVLVAGAGLMLKGLWHLHRVDPGFDPSRVATFRVSVTPTRYPGKPQIKEFIRQASERLAALPGVEVLGAINLRPLTDREFNFTYVAEGHPASPGVPAPAASLRITTPGYSRAMGIPLIEGRDFNAGADGETAGIINARMARELWPGESAIGKRINLWSPDGPEFTVVGVVGTVRQQRVDTEGTPEMYLPHERFTSPTMTFTVRTVGAPAQMIPELKQAIWSVDDGIPISEIATMEEVVRYSLADSRFFAGLLAAFGVLALGLGALGVYGVLAYSVSERRHEIGVRIALGAARGTVQRWVVAQGLLPVGLGLGLGMLASFWATRLLAAHLYQVGARDLSIFGGVALTLIVVALLATWLPARRASRIDPIQALRAE